VHRAIGWLLFAVVLETALTIGHFVYGARLYDDPSREHVVVPAVVFLLLAAALGGLYLWRPGRLTLSLLAAEVGAVYVGLFGGYHGAFNHALKDALFFTGMAPERLAQIFDTPDFALPNDVFFELSGVATVFAALVVGHLVIRLVRLAWRRNAEVTGA
jgi:hypothetical protein